jgi:hypothetical protein
MIKLKHKSQRRAKKMRKLSAKQKKIVQRYWEEDKLDNTNVEYHLNKEQLLEELEKINDYETLWSDLDRLICDLIFSDNYIETIRKFN